MHLSWLGLSAVKIETSGAVLVTDPYAPAVAARPLRAKADIVTLSNPRSELHNHVAAITGDPFVIESPGEFEVKGVYVQGLALAAPPAPEEGAAHPARSGRTPSPVNSRAASTLFLFDAEGMRLAHVGDTRRAPPADVLERLDGVDVLFLPVGGGSTLDPEAAMTVVNEIEPKLVVPMHFQAEGFRTGEKLLPVTAFLREMGASKVEPVERLSVKKRDLPEEETRVVLFRL